MVSPDEGRGKAYCSFGRSNLDGAGGRLCRIADAAGFCGRSVKLGLSNIFALVALLLYSPVDAFTVTIIRCTIGSLMLGGSPTGFIYSLTGGLASCAAMSLLNPLFKKGMISPVGLSVAGSFCFNAGQLIIGVAAVGPPVAAYFPLMGLLSVPTGICVGIIAWLVYSRLKNVA